MSERRLVGQRETVDREELAHRLQRAIVLHLVVLCRVHQDLHELRRQRLQVVALLLNLIEVWHHQEFGKDEFEGIDHFLLVLLGLIGRLVVVGALDGDVLDDQLDDDFEYPLVVHDESSLRTLGLVSVQCFFRDFLQEVHINGMIRALLELLEPAVVEELAEILSKGVEELVE